MGSDGKGVILIVDDSQDDRDLLARALKKLERDRPIVSLSAGNEALDYFIGRNIYADRAEYPLPAIVFLDLKMPPPDGFDVLAFLNSQPNFEKPLIVVLSGVAATKEIQRAYELGAHTYLIKPVQGEDLRNLVAFFSRYWHTTPTS